MTRSTGHPSGVTSVSFVVRPHPPHSYALAATRITIGASVGIPLSSFCIIRRLHNISCTQAVAVTREEVRPATGASAIGLTLSQKRNAILIDTFICVFIPMIELVLGATYLFLELSDALLDFQPMLSRVTASTSSKSSGASQVYTIPSLPISSFLHGPS